MNRKEISHVYDCLGRHLLGGPDGNRDQVLDEVVYARKPFTRSSDRCVDKPTSQSNAGVPPSPPVGNSYYAYDE